MIRLLKKSEVKSLQAKEKRAEIDQGLQLAKRVDALRETAVEEEKALIKFRNEMVARIHEQIQAEQTKRDLLIEEVNRLRLEKEEGMKRVLERERKADERLEALGVKEKELEASIAAVKELEKKAEEARQEASRVMERSKTAYGRSVELFRLADDIAQDAKKKFDQALEKELQVDKKVETENKRLDDMETVLAAKARDIEIRRFNLDAKEADLIHRERALRDKYDTLLKATKLSK